MFKLKDKNCTMTSINIRAELHGPEEKEPASDIFIKVEGSNSMLDMFDRELLPAFYKEKRDEEKDLVDKASKEKRLDSLRFPMFRSALGYGWEGAGYRVVINYGITGDNDIIFINTELDKFKFLFKEGGTIEITFRIKAHPNEKEFGQLCMLTGQEIDLTLEPPSAVDMLDQVA